MTQEKPKLTIIIFPNGMVAVCRGQKQVPMLQGKWSEKKKILLLMIEKGQAVITHGDVNQN